jgi:hypothetical protein
MLQPGLSPLLVNLNLLTFQIDAPNSAAQDASAFQASTQRSGNMRRFQAARGNFNKHRREQP